MTSSAIPLDPFQVGELKKEENLFKEKIDVDELLKNEETNGSSQNLQ